MKLKILFPLFFFGVLLTACEKTIDLDLKQVEERTVIDGLVTDRKGRSYVRVSKSVGFYDGGEAPKITNATVTVEDSDGNIFDFTHYQGEDSDSVGLYLPEKDFVGVVGKSYKLSVLVDGQSYEAEDKLIRLPQITKLEYRINEDEFKDPEDPGRYYELLLYVIEPQDTRDYYLFKSVRNGKIEYMSETDIYFSDDELVSEQIDGIPLPLFYEQNDLAGVEVYSLSRQAFVFYRDLSKLLNNDGGLFGPTPANPRSNLSNGAVGFFQVSSIESAELVIE